MGSKGSKQKKCPVGCMPIQRQQQPFLRGCGMRPQMPIIQMPCQRIMPQMPIPMSYPQQLPCQQQQQMPIQYPQQFPCQQQQQMPILYPPQQMPIQYPQQQMQTSYYPSQIQPQIQQPQQIVVYRNSSSRSRSHPCPPGCVPAKSFSVYSNQTSSSSSSSSSSSKHSDSKSKN